MSIHTLVGLVSRCVRLCRENREQTPARAVRTDLGRFPGADGGRKLRQDKEQASSATLCSVTSARSAGSYGGFQGVPKWGQNRKNDITSAVVIPPKAYSCKKIMGVMPRKICYREQKGIFRSAERQNGRCLFWAGEHPQKLRRKTKNKPRRSSNRN